MSKLSSIPALEARAEPNAASSIHVDCDVVAVFQDSGGKLVAPAGPYSELVRKFRKNESFSGRSASVQFVRFGGQGSAENVLFVGAGVPSETTEEKIRQAGGVAWGKLSAERVRTVAIHVDTLFGARGLKAELTLPRLTRAFAEGMILAAYQFNKYKTRNGGARQQYAGPSRLIFLTREKSLKRKLETELARVRAVGEAVNVTRDWSNEPSNLGTPEYYANEARKLARQFGLSCKILSERDAAREKMGLFLGVGQGPEREGKIVIVEYRPKASQGGPRGSYKTLALVGKGVTFDSGGISIKPALRMEAMKHDMTGAATIMGALLLASEWKVSNRVIGIMAFTENMPDGNAIQPGNVLTSRSGKTVEVINTDAEGRLILADVLDYAQDMKPDAIVDVATLTGAVSIALGKHCCAILGNEDPLIDAVRRAGELNGERIWQLPLYDEYFEDLRTDSADLRNSANDSYGGTIRAAMFLRQFIRKGVSWAHLDIAATGSGMGHLPYYPKNGASGAYVRTLAQLAQDL